MQSRLVVLCYHAANVNGNAYENNDHVALASDLELLAELAIPIVPASLALGVVDGSGAAPPIAAALTFDDGITLDAEDFLHPAHGNQRSLLGVLADHTARRGITACASSFVIASPDARAELDRKDFLSLGVWHDDWWAPATRSGILKIENHSWDHNHPTLSSTAAPAGTGGDFRAIADLEHCSRQVLDACDYIRLRSGRSPELFAYPWGQASDFLRRDFLPVQGRAAGLLAAFSTQPGPVSRGADRWWLPRYVCGEHWRTSAQLRALLTDARQ